MPKCSLTHQKAEQRDFRHAVLSKPYKPVLCAATRPVLFTLGGALMGLGYYALVGCSTGSCAITASPVNTILYMGLMGWLLSGIFGSQSA